MKVFMKICIATLFVYNLFVAFNFYNVAIPVNLDKSRETEIISRMSQFFSIQEHVAKAFFSHGTLKGVDPVLLASIAVPESRNNPDVISPKGYKGRMQSSLVKLPDEVEMLNATVKLVDFTKMAKGDTNKALRMYNGGTNPEVYNSSHCQHYAKTVLSIYKQASKFVYRI